MPVPKRKVSKQRRNKRFANKGMKAGAVMACLTCQGPLAPHQVCKGCGYYKGRKVIVTKTDKIQRRNEALQAKQAEAAAATKEAE